VRLQSSVPGTPARGVGVGIALFKTHCVIFDVLTYGSPGKCKSGASSSISGGWLVSLLSISAARREGIIRSIRKYEVAISIRSQMLEILTRVESVAYSVTRREIRRRCGG
jgi:hypothetical protein